MRQRYRKLARQKRSMRGGGRATDRPDPPEAEAIGGPVHLAVDPQAEPVDLQPLARLLLALVRADDDSGPRDGV